jgi:SAM-dependent methyltransferase
MELFHRTCADYNILCYTSAMTQQQAWNNEYQHAQGVPTSTRTSPSSAVKRLIGYIEEHKLDTGKRVIDLGCGIGRNAFYLAELGYEVTGVDFAESALKKLEQAKSDHMGGEHVTTKHLNLAKQLPFPDRSFDIATDIVTTMTLTPEELPSFELEMRRIVRPGGLFLTYVLASDDGYLQATNPGQTQTTVQDSGITDNYLSEERLRRLYVHWTVLEMEKTEKQDIFYGREYTRRIWWMLLKNEQPPEAD